MNLHFQRALAAMFLVFSIENNASRDQVEFRFDPKPPILSKGKPREQLKQAFGKFFQVNAEFPEKSIKHYLELEPGVFFIYFTFVPEYPEISKKVFGDSRIHSRDNRSLRHIVATFDVNKGEFHLVSNGGAINPELGEKSALVSGLNHSGRGESRVYGCHVGFPFRFLDIDGDGRVELIVTGGFGQIYTDPNGSGVDVSAKTILRIYKLEATTFKQIYSAVLSEERYGSELFAAENGIKNPGYQSFSNYSFANGVWEYSYLGLRGERVYSKLYFSDFNKNGRMNIIQRRVRFLSRESGDLIKGFELIDDDLKLHEMSSSGFVEIKTSQQKIRRIYEESKLDWISGWPRNNRCKGSGYVRGKLEKYVSSSPIIIEYSTNPNHKLEAW